MSAATTPHHSAVLTITDGSGYKYDFMDFWEGMVVYRKDQLWTSFESILE